MSRTRHLGLGLATAAGASLLALAGAELWARVARPSLPVQQIDASRGAILHGEGATLHWTKRNPGSVRTTDGCPEGAAGPRITLVGSSILWGSKTESADAPGPGLRAALEDRGVSDPCVWNLAQPAGTYQTQRARLAAEGEVPTDILLWELWHNSPHEFVRIGDAAFNFGSLERNADGVPDPFGLGGLARPLLGHSALYAWVALNRAPRRTRGRSVQEEWADFAAVFLPEAQAAAEARGATLVLVSFPSLDQPFVDQQARNDKSYRAVQQPAEAAGVPFLALDRALVGTDPARIGADTCCHYNPEGVRQVSGLLADTLVPLLGAPQN